MSNIRSSLTTEAVKTITAKTITSAMPIIGSRLDSCNSILAGTSAVNLTCLRLVQLPVCQRIDSKIRLWFVRDIGLTITITITTSTVFKVLHYQQPSWNSLKILAFTSRSLWSSASTTISEEENLRRKPQWYFRNHFPQLYPTFGINCLVIFSSVSTLLASRRHLKHHLFLEAYHGYITPASRTSNVMPSA